jgi:glycosyltransferase involved in cell wall biosynthesis
MPAGDNPQPLVTIVMPTYNRQQFLEGAIESVVAQDYPRLELIVLDDGSTDDTPAILERHARSHPERFRHTSHENMGQVRTLNRGFELARGELVGFLCDDDRLLPGAVSKVAGTLIDDPEAVLAYGGWHFVDETGAIIDTHMPIEYSVVDAIMLMDWVVGPGALFRRSVFDQVGDWDPALTFCADWDFWLRIAPLGRFLRISEPLALWTQHEDRLGGIEGQGPEQAREYVEMADRAFAHEELRVELEGRADFEQVRVRAYRNAYVLAAWAAGPGMNTYGERYYIADRHWRSHLEREGRPEDLEARIAELSTETWRLHDELSERDTRIVQIEERFRALEAERDMLVEYRNRPLWWHMARALTPTRLRPLAKRLAGHR